MNTLITTLTTAFIAGVTVSIAANCCTTVYLHRALSHRALTIRTAPALVFRAFIWLSTGIKPKEWVAVHRKHHAFTDVEGDPHSPILLGWKTVQKKNVALYRATGLHSCKHLPGKQRRGECSWPPFWSSAIRQQSNKFTMARISHNG